MSHSTGEVNPATGKMRNPGQEWVAGPSEEIASPSVEWDGNEPFLEASADVRVTPFRADDVERLTSLFNHPIVGEYAYGRPFPYTEESARLTISQSQPSKHVLETLRQKGVLDSCPFMAIRYRGELVGNVNAFNRDDGRGVFGITYDVHPDYHRKGIARAAVLAVLGWCGRGMEAEKVEAYTNSTNSASAGLLARVGFTEVNHITTAWPAINGGGERDITVWQRELPTPAPWVAVASPAPSPPAVNLEKEYIDLGGGISITPLRDTPAEIKELMELSNHPDVAQWTYTRPSPYLASDARDKLDKSIPAQQVALSELRSGKIVSSLPFTVLRDSHGRYIGDIALYRVPYCPDRLELSYTVHPDFQGRGIGSRAALAVLGFAGARMACSKFQAYTQVANVASRGVLKKLGFVVGEERSFKWSPNKGGGWRPVLIWERELGDPEPPWIAAVVPPPPLPTLAWDGEEPYLALKGGLRITPYRDTEADISAMVDLSNLDIVAKWRYAVPAEFTLDNARMRLDHNLPLQQLAVAELRNSTADSKLAVPTMPFTVIRDESGQYIGDLILVPQPGYETSPDHTWVLGYKLHPNWHGRGIGYAAVHAMLGFAVQHLGAKKVEAYAQVANVASTSLLKKLGFTLAETRIQKWPGGGWRESCRWQCEYSA